LELKHENEEENVPISDDFKDLDGKKAENDAVFAFTLTDLPEDVKEEDGSVGSEKEESAESLYGETLFEAAARLVVEEGVTSVSFLQRSLGIGYDKAARIVERLEEISIVSPLDGNRPRRVLVSAEKLEKILSDLKRG
jgi:S-DNA-T family DNA segregation ATPase FtsK/SpoIIIE